MKITSIELHPDGSSFVCELSFRDPTRQNPYNVKGIAGLDADEIVPRSYGDPGTQAFYDLMMVKKEPVFLIELNPDYSENQTPSSLRDNLYRMIASSRKGNVDLWFKNDEDVVATISGSIRKLESDLFAETPQVQITIKCKEPFLKAPTPVDLVVVGLDPSLTVIDDPLSTGPHGYKFELEVTAPFASMEFSDPDDAEWTFEIVPLGGFLTGDVIYFSSEYNNKYLYMIRAAATVYLADVITPGSVWPIMFPGETSLSVTNGPSLDWQAISYYPTYWGV